MRQRKGGLIRQVVPLKEVQDTWNLNDMTRKGDV